VDASRSYDVTADGKRFLLTKLPGEKSPPRIMVVLNWFQELRANVLSNECLDHAAVTWQDSTGVDPVRNRLSFRNTDLHHARQHSRRSTSRANTLPTVCYGHTVSHGGRITSGRTEQYAAASELAPIAPLRRACGLPYSSDVDAHEAGVSEVGSRELEVGR
jgi:hypothetical protein